MSTETEQLSFPPTWPQPLSQRVTLVADVNLLAIHDGCVLLGRRQNTGFEDGSFHLPAGHLEGGESLLTALLREAWEELGIQLDPDHPRLVHVMHHSAAGGRLSFFFEVTEWLGQIVNKEPEKCKSLDWYPLVELPARTIPYTQQAIAAYLSGSYLSCRGWSYGLPGVVGNTRAGRSTTAVGSAKPTLVG